MLTTNQRDIVAGIMTYMILQRSHDYVTETGRYVGTYEICRSILENYNYEAEGEVENESNSSI